MQFTAHLPKARKKFLKKDINEVEHDKKIY
jgi:hypothetical protein